MNQTIGGDNLGLCPHGREKFEKPARQAEEDFDWERENEDQRMAWESENLNIENGTCMCCGQPYSKNVSESNVSRSGYCMTCGFNP